MFAEVFGKSRCDVVKKVKKDEKDENKMRIRRSKTKGAPSRCDA